jgi:hypothetical protein
VRCAAVGAYLGSAPLLRVPVRPRPPPSPTSSNRHHHRLLNPCNIPPFSEPHCSFATATAGQSGGGGSSRDRVVAPHLVTREQEVTMRPFVCPFSGGYITRIGLPIGLRRPSPSCVCGRPSSKLLSLVRQLSTTHCHLTYSSSLAPAPKFDSSGERVFFEERTVYVLPCVHVRSVI